MTAGTPTSKLYLSDPYKTVFNARVVRCDPDDDGRPTAVLDETYFYPESGGQTADCGTIAGVRVVDVWEDEGEVVHHVMESRIEPGSAECHVDWERRLDHMQQHTGQHVLSRALIQVAGLNTVSFHMGDEACTIDLDGEPAADAIDEAERLANAIIQENRPVHIRVMSPDELEDVALRKKLPEGVREVRLVEVEDFDVIGCCGTHVRRTGELGLIKVLKQERVKGASRVTFKVGKRALQDYALKHGIVRDLAGRFTTSVEGLGDKIAKLSDQAQAERKRSQKLSKRLAALEAAELLASAEEHNNVRFIVRVLGDYDEDYLRLLSAELKNESGTVNMLGNDDGAVVCNASKGTAVDFSQPVVERVKAAGGSGGGKGGFATVRLPAGVVVADFLGEAVASLKKQL